VVWEAKSGGGVGGEEKGLMLVEKFELNS